MFYDQHPSESLDFLKIDLEPLELELSRKQNILPIMCDLHIKVQILAPALASLLLLSQSLGRHLIFSTLITTYNLGPI
jgi:hypothetical protein